MATSSRLIDYSLRPAKAVERRMLCDLFRRLEAFSAVESYHYVGFGSIYFADFRLFHSLLGINEMISIERDRVNIARFEFNKPFKNVDLKPGHSNEVLPRIPWAKRSIVWLDYDGRLDKSVLADVATFCTNAVSGSLILISINVEADRLPELGPEEQKHKRLELFEAAVGSENVPIGVTGANLRGGDFSSVCYGILNNQIQTHLDLRNGPLEVAKRIKYTQLIHLEYSDNAQMLTVGGIVCSNEEMACLEACGFDCLSFVNRTEVPTKVRAPKFTKKEVGHLNSMLPNQDTAEVDLPGVPRNDIEDFCAIYRYYPTFGELLLG